MHKPTKNSSALSPSGDSEATPTRLQTTPHPHCKQIVGHRYRRALLVMAACNGAQKGCRPRVQSFLCFAMWCFLMSPPFSLHDLRATAWVELLLSGSGLPMTRSRGLRDELACSSSRASRVAARGGGIGSNPDDLDLRGGASSSDVQGPRCGVGNDPLLGQDLEVHPQRVRCGARNGGSVQAFPHVTPVVWILWVLRTRCRAMSWWHGVTVNS